MQENLNQTPLSLSNIGRVVVAVLRHGRRSGEARLGCRRGKNLKQVGERIEEGVGYGTSANSRDSSST